MKTLSTQKGLYVTVFVCAYSRCILVYEHSSTADIIRISLLLFFEDTNSPRERCRPNRFVRRDNAREYAHVPAKVMAWLDYRQNRSETSNPYNIEYSAVIVVPFPSHA